MEQWVIATEDGKIIGEGATFKDAVEQAIEHGEIHHSMKLTVLHNDPAEFRG